MAACARHCGREAYDAAQEEMGEAEEQTIAAFQAKKEVAAELRVAKAENDEALRFKQKVAQRAHTKQQYYLWQLFHIERDIELHKKRHAELRRELRRLEGQENSCTKRLDKSVKKHREANKALGKANEAASKLAAQARKRQAKLESLVEAVASAEKDIRGSKAREARVRAQPSLRLARCAPPHRLARVTRVLLGAAGAGVRCVVVLGGTTGRDQGGGAGGEADDAEGASGTAGSGTLARPRTHAHAHARAHAMAPACVLPRVRGWHRCLRLWAWGAGVGGAARRSITGARQLRRWRR